MNMTNRQLYELGVKKLRAANMEDSHLNARELLGKVISCDCRSAAFEVMLEQACDMGIPDRFMELCERRISGEPLQYILGEWEFYGFPFKVGKGVLIPRQDTETIVDTVLKKADKNKSLKIIDLCSGSGCIAIALKKNLPDAEVYAVENSPEAIKYLEKNIMLNECQVKIFEADVLDMGTPDCLPLADIIVSNPPYLTKDDMECLQREVEFEPEYALFGGDDGLDFYRYIVMMWKEKLVKGGLMAFEVGINQEDDVMKILVQHGFENVRCKADMCGVNRCVFGNKK